MGKIKDKLFYKFSFLGFKISVLDILLFLVLTGIVIYLRAIMFPHESNDYKSFLYRWYSTLKAHNGFGGIGLSLGDYTPIYIYFLAAITYIPLKAVALIKIFSVIFDFLLAFFVLKISYNEYKNTAVAVMLYGITLVLPTLIINSSYWGQCDIIYTFFCVMSVYYVAKNKPMKSAIMFSIAFCFKLQAIFLAPFLFLCLLKKKIKLRYVLTLPVVYIISVLPSFFAGRSFTELLGIYFKQTGEYTSLSLNAPNIWYFFNDNKNEMLTIIAVMLCGVLVLSSIVYLCYKEFEFNTNIYFTIALFFAILVPFFLPRMHERYFFMADIFAFIFAIYNPKKFYVPILVIVSSIGAYSPFIFKKTIMPIEICALLMLIALLLVGMNLYKQIKKASV